MSSHPALSEALLEELCTIPYPVPSPLYCKICYNPKAPASTTGLRKIGIFKENSRYTRHLRDAHKIATASRVRYECVRCGRRDPNLKKLAKHLCTRSLPSPSVKSNSPDSLPQHLRLPRPGNVPRAGMRSLGGTLLLLLQYSRLQFLPQSLWYHLSHLRHLCALAWRWARHQSREPSLVHLEEDLSWCGPPVHVESPPRGLPIDALRDTSVEDLVASIDRYDGSKRLLFAPSGCPSHRWSTGGIPSHCPVELTSLSCSLPLHRAVDLADEGVPPASLEVLSPVFSCGSDRVDSLSPPIEDTPIPSTQDQSTYTEWGHLHPFPTLVTIVLASLKELPCLPSVPAAATGDAPSIPPCSPVSPSVALPILAGPFPPVSPVPPSQVLCPYCEKGFRTQKGLNSHLVTVHRYGTTDGEGTLRPLKGVTKQPSISDFFKEKSPDIMEVVETAPPPPGSSPSGKGSSRRKQAKRVKFDLPTPAPVPGPSQASPSSSLGGNLAGEVPVPAPTPPVNIPKATPELTSFQKEWLERIESISDGASLEDALGKFTTILGGRSFRRRGRGHRRSTSATSRAVPPVDLPPAETTSGAAGSSSGATSAGSSSTSKLKYNPAEASDIQKSFRANQRRTLQTILSGPPQYCSIPPEQVEAHFRGVFSRVEWDPSFEFHRYPLSMADHLLLARFDPEEVWDKLRGLKNSAPGPDGIQYSTLKARDPGAHLLTAIFNKVLDLSTIPSSWKNAKVVLIPISGDPSDINNWRPVSLLNTTGKVFSSVLAARLSSWSDINNRLSSFQKGFRENDGCAEHNFLLEQAIGHARRAHKDISMAWLDLENAFGSVPHTFILGALERAGVPESTIALVSALYTGSTSTIRVESGWTDPIPMCAGVRQGCPLSSIIFNLTLEQILRTGLPPDAGFELFSKSISYLAYADDLLIIDSSPAGLQRTIDLLSSQANRAGLKFKPAKCASLSFSFTSHRRHIDPSLIRVNNVPITNITDQDAYKYLGVRVSFSFRQDHGEFFRGISADVEIVFESLLAPWQKLTAIRAHVLARAEFLCRNSHIRKRDVADLDKTLIRVGKKIMNLPTRANNNLVHLSCSKGGAALPEFRSLLDIHAVSHAFRLLASHDPNISGVAAESLRSVVRKKLFRDPTSGECCDFLNGKKDGDFARESGDISTQWSRARHAFQRLSSALRLEWLFVEGTGYHLNIYRSPNPVCVSPSSAGLVVRGSGRPNRITAEIS
ncbi:retrovirus-related Pol polyprotein from type-2 retrotransposable element R2DM [Nephila pilipes]|uniref:Retrovirus-related Pol polyprotein from type-2 retrotransposable element R2DM n=1 Tax=Nephila pilipes TaxID=299642 RepID=A0A8X6P9P3_NEPPI|nr:retrovirus-related Pol polyprotein from type-2 retrotransposable element R2DM [Nephila pilipes]